MQPTAKFAHFFALSLRSIIAQKKRTNLAAADCGVKQKMKPTPFYMCSAVFYSFSLAVLVAYPAAAIFSKPGFSPSNDLWLGFTLLLGFSLTVYSAIPKRKAIFTANWLVLPLLSAVFYYICKSVNPEAVVENAGALLLFSIFTFGGPIWLPVIGFFVHLSACISAWDADA